jgi:RecB family exonuclease
MSSRRYSTPRTPGVAPAHRSVSQLEMLAGCGQQFAFRYLDGLKEPGSLAKAKGSAIHGAAQGNFTQKIESDADIPLDDFRDLAAERFVAETKGSLLFTPSEESTGIRKAVAEQKDATVKLAEFYHTTISPDYRPAATEEEFTIELPSAGTTLIGVIDLRDILDRIIDHKTSKRAKSQKDADGSLQLTTYAAARTKVGRPPPSIVLDTAVQTAGGKAYRNKLVTTRGPEDYAALAARIVAAEKVIKSGAFMPAPAKAWWCSAEWCGFHRICPFVNGKQARPTDE